MRLDDLSEDIIFDEFDEDPGPNKKFFISSVLTFPNIFINPDNFKAKIYTSKNLASQMRTYFYYKGVMLNKIDVVKLESSVPLELQNDKGEAIEVVMFESEDINKNVMFMFRKAKKTTHVYAGVCRELRGFIFSSVFVEWIKVGVSKLYVDVSRTTTAESESRENSIAATIDERDPRELENTIDTIEILLNKNPKMIILNIPKLGYETLVYRLSQRLRARVSIGGIMSAVFQTLEKNKYFVSSYKDAKILIAHTSHTLQEMKSFNKTQNYVFVQITDKTRDIYNHIGFYELGWSPLPSAFELQLLATILHPDRIYAIHHNSNFTRMTPQVPHFLLKLCTHYAQILEEMHQVKNNEIKALEDISVMTSTDSSVIGGNNGGSMKMTQDASTCDDRQKRVQEWLTSEQGNDDATELDTNDEAKKVSAKTAKANKRSSITKFLSQAQQKNNTTQQPTTSAKLFRIQKGSLKYLEDSDSN